MKIKNTKYKINLPIILIVGLAILFILLAVFFILRHNNETTLTTPSETQETQSSLDAKQNLINNPNSQDSDSTPKPDESSITITSTQTVEDVTIFTKLINVASGSCTIDVTNGKKTYTRTVPVIYQPQFSSCAGYNISKESLNRSGTWNVTLKVSNEEINITKTTTIEVN